MSHRDDVLLAVLWVFWCGMLFAGALCELDAGALHWARAWYTFCAVIAPIMAGFVAWGLTDRLNSAPVTQT